MAEGLAHIAHVLERLVDAGRLIFPIRQQVNGQEVHRRLDFRVLQPELPDIGIGDGLLDLAFNLMDQRHQLLGGDFLAQQGFVADDHRGHHVRAGVGRRDQLVDLFFGRHGVAADPGPGHDFQPMLARHVRQGLQAGHGVGANAFKARSQ